MTTTTDRGVWRLVENDTSRPFPFALKRDDGSVVDITSDTIKFLLEKEDGTAKVAETTSNVSKTGAANGQGQYAWQASDVDTPGLYTAWIIRVDSNSKRETFPTDQRGYPVLIEEGPVTNA